ncbi:MAG TPA: lytic transglycosylase domain-containing protein, partial [Pyrinomonadaceae bacterium]|nr:lytic transglycosylase domain-containing protein [Pyrinomonadaceae bacterium]
MKMRRHLPVNLSLLALAALLLQSEAQAREEQTQQVRTRDVRKWRSKGLSGVRKHERLRLARSRLRERARVYEPWIRAAAYKHGVDPRVLWTIAFLETRFRPELVSPMKARGLMQFMPDTARRFNLSNPHDAAAAIDAAARYVKQLATQFDGRLELVLAGYNAGEGAVESYRAGRSLRTSRGKVINPRRIKTNGVPPYRETILYVKRGVLVFNKVTSAGVFSPELVATAGPMRVPSLTVSFVDQVLIDRELKGLNATPAT